MNKHLILSVVLCFVFTGGAFAQSGSKSYGSSSRSKGSSSRTAIKADRETTRAKEKLVSQMTRKDFEAVKLNRDQKKTLMQMVDTKYPMMAQLDGKIAGSIPSDQIKSLQRAFRNAKKDGSSEVEAMSMSMEKIGLPEMVQEKVLMMNQEKKDIREAILTSVAASFDEEQKAAYMAFKKEMMGEEMADKEMAEKGMTEKGMTEKEMVGEEKEMMDKEKEMTDKEMPEEKKMMEDKEMAATSSGSSSK